MTEDKNDFEWTQLDQQIEQPARYLDAPASHLIEDLQQMYHTGKHINRADRESLQRVRELLTARLQPAHQEPNIVSFAELRTHHERKSTMFEATETTKSRSSRQKASMSQNKSAWQRFPHALNTIAAVLVVAVLLGSIVTVFTIKKGAQHPNGTTVGSTHIATPLPKLDCSQVVSSDQGPDNGEHAVCLQGLETPLHGSTTLNGYKVTLISAYADANRLLVKYAVIGNDINADRYSGVPSISRLNYQSGVLTDHEPWTFGGGAYYDRIKNQTIFVVPFPTQTVPTTIGHLQITVEFTAITGAAPNNPAGTAFPYDSLTFTIPFHTEKRVATPNQSTVINGHRATLSQVVVTASGTYLFVKTETIHLTTMPVSAYPSATINGNSNVETAFTTDGQINGKWNPVTGFSLGAPEDWLTQSMAWTLNLHFTGIPLGNGSGIIQFIVPR